MCYFVTYSCLRECACECFVHLLICEKGDRVFSPWTGHTQRTAPTWWQTREGDDWGEMWLTEDLLFPNHWCLLSSILSGTWTSDEGAKQQLLPLLFLRVRQTLLQVAHYICEGREGGQVYLGMVYFIANDIIRRNKISPSHILFFYKT